MNHAQFPIETDHLALACVFSATASHSAENADTNASRLNKKDTPAAEAAPRPERILSQPPDVLHLPSIETLGVALKNRDAMNPKPLSKEWQARVIKAAGVPLEYVRENGGDTHVFKLPRKMTFDEAEAVAARIRALPEIFYADPSVGGGALSIQGKQS